MLAGSGGAFFSSSGSGWSQSPQNSWPAPVQAFASEAIAYPISDTRMVVGLGQAQPVSGGIVPYVRAIAIWNEGTWLAPITLVGTHSHTMGAWSPDGVEAYVLVNRQDLNTCELRRFNGTSWSTVATHPVAVGTFGDRDLMDGTSANDLWITGNRMLHWNGTALTELPTPYSGTFVTMKTMIASTPTLAFARSYDGTLIKWDGTSWMLDTSMTSKVLWMWKSTQGTPWAVDDMGRVWRYVTGAWSSVALPAGYLASDGIWGRSDADVNVKAQGRDEVCTWNGSSWTCSPIPPGFMNNRRIVKTATREWSLSSSDFSAVLRK